ncbi:hypothetical protein LOTGIDRAFT_229135 [Lottia gigantea]|uniref:Pectin acetylesterase n=1 Tax=Lottia gigantea TaxID=225164 RepID=V4BKY5_LOTGI|nr:hypothetical protein LOTGIDRAFT_229135 [Lottia gigantea]ESO89249.1 hypothetical protein LOTGIDRAFT_229135 [Lottia gigantea]
MASLRIQTLVLLVGFIALLFGLRYIANWNGKPRVVNTVSSILVPKKAQLVVVPDKYVVPQRAYCLDGSNPGYFIRKSSTTSVKNWIIHLRLGAWCTSKENCLQRSRTELGSTKNAINYMDRSMRNSNCTLNPHFCNWNVVEFIYCDGGSYAGSVGETVHVNGKPLYLRGAAIFDVLIQHLLDTTKLSQAQHVLLTGSSAGSLAVLVHLDHLKQLLPKTVLSIKGISDGGIFLDQTAVDGQRIMKDMLKDTYHLHNIKDTPSLNNCFKGKDDNSKWECFMPEHLYKFVQLPVLFVSSYYDSWYMPTCLRLRCATQSQQCTSEEDTIVKKHLSAVNTVARDILKMRGNGVYLTSCQSHTLLGPNYKNVKSKGLHPYDAVVMWLNDSEKSLNITELESYQTSRRNC